MGNAIDIMHLTMVIMSACEQGEHLCIAAADEGRQAAHVTRSGILTTRPQLFDGLMRCQIRSLKLRYFTPREIANLHSFPPSFSFPEHVTLRQRYALLGNSLSALVVAELLRYMLNDVGS